jgi:uncharacterized membrane protein
MRLAAAPMARKAVWLALALTPLCAHLVLASRAGAPGAVQPAMERVLGLGLFTLAALIHTGVYATLLVGFGASLRPGRVALITALARRMYGAIPDEMAHYTRGVTWAWSSFFAAQLLISAALFVAAPLSAWSFFVNIVNIPSVILMWLLEEAYRMSHLSNPPRFSLAEVKRMAFLMRESLSGRAPL